MAKFLIANPFRLGSTMYVHGDLICMSPMDYSITFLARHMQIEFRGLRVEIESVLKSADDAVGNAAVITAERF